MTENDPANAVVPSVINTNRGRVGRGDFPPAPVSITFASSQLQVADRKCSWENWVDKELSDPSFRVMLIQAQIFDAISLSRQGIFYGDIEAILFLLRHWNPITHTFHAAFEEITVTLEDVAVATLLPLTDDIDPANCGNSLMAEDQQVRTTLFIIHNSLLPTKHWKIMKSTSLTSWCAYFDEHKEVHARIRRAAFVWLWLSKYIFGGFPNNRIIPGLASLTIKLSGGFPASLASLLLGILYHHLDSFHDSEVLGAGYNFLQTAVHFPVLQMFLWERYTSFFGPFASRSSIKKHYEDKWGMVGGFTVAYLSPNGWIRCR